MCGLVHTCRYFDPARGDVFSASWREARRRRENDGDPGMTRTSDLRFRKPPLYPAELRDREPAHSRAATGSPASQNGRRLDSHDADGQPERRQQIRDAAQVSAARSCAQKSGSWPKEPLKFEGPKNKPSTSARRRASARDWKVGSRARGGARSPVTDG